jgi:hypothetical protein
MNSSKSSKLVLQVMQIFGFNKKNIMELLLMIKCMRIFCIKHIVLKEKKS